MKSCEHTLANLIRDGHYESIASTQFIIVDSGIKPIVLILYILGTALAALSLYLVCTAISKRLKERSVKKREKRRQKREKRKK
jgi:beta-lactamase regulating signal transducer with metallopeptidase domain